MKNLNKFFTITFFLFLVLSPLYAEGAKLENAASTVEQVQEMNSPLLDDQALDEQVIHEMSYWKEFSRMMMILGFILGVVLLIAWLLKGFLNNRIKQINETNIIKVLERRNLSQKSMIYLVEIYEKQYLIGDSASGGVEFLANCEPNKEAITLNEETPLSRSGKASFMQILQKKLSEKQNKQKSLKND